MSPKRGNARGHKRKKYATFLLQSSILRSDIVPFRQKSLNINVEEEDLLHLAFFLFVCFILFIFVPFFFLRFCFSLSFVFSILEIIFIFWKSICIES